MNKITLSPTYNLKQRLTLGWFLLWFILLAACTAQGEINPSSAPPASIQETAATQSTVDATPTTPATSEPTATPTASRTPTATETPTAAELSATPTATNTPLPTATLTAEEWQQRWQIVDARVAAMMATNNGCQLPCWWGITSGDTVSDAWEIFETIDENGWVDSPFQWGELEGIGYFGHRYRDERGEDIYAGFLVNLRVQDKQVAVFDIYAGRSVDFAAGTAEYNQVGERLVRDWEQFSIRSLVEKYGEPDLIYIMPHGTEYNVNLYYPDMGIVASYRPRIKVNELGQRTICHEALDTFDIMSIKLYLYNPLTGLPPDYIRATYPLWPLGPELLISEDTRMVELSRVEAVTGMSINEFVTLTLPKKGIGRV
jgi:hypothetical protein